MDDLISRKALIAEYDRVHIGPPGGARKLMEDAPSVDAVEVVHGRWHDVYLMTPWIATGICSHCNLKSYINPDFPFAKYCPNCGAKMDGGNEDG